MNTKESILFFAGAIAGIVGSFLRITQTEGGDFFLGIGTGLYVGLALTVLPKIFNRKNETSTK